MNPEVAIYSAGRNNSYGHPHDEVIDRLRSLGIAIYGTDINGTVRVISDGATYRVEPSVGQALQGMAPAWLQPAATPLIQAPAVPAAAGWTRSTSTALLPTNWSGSSTSDRNERGRSCG